MLSQNITEASILTHFEMVFDSSISKKFNIDSRKLNWNSRIHPANNGKAAYIVPA